MTPAEYHRLVKATGQGAKQILERAIGPREWGRLSDYAKKKLLQETIMRARDAAGKAMLTESRELQGRGFEKKKEAFK